MEYFDESILLLKHYLDFLTYEDLVYLKKQQRQKVEQSIKESDNNLNFIKQKSREWNSLEFQIYQHFNKTFFEKIEQVFDGFDSQKMIDEKSQLNAALENFRETCMEPESDDKKLLGSSGGALPVIRYAVKRGLPADVTEQCDKTTRIPLKWVDIIYRRQYV